MKERIYRIPAGIPHTIAQLSDIHGQDGNEILKILIRRRPSLIAVSGDLFLDHAQEGDNLIDLQPKVIPLIRACTALAPTYISLGNHEWLASPADIRALQSTGAVLLDNRWVRDQGTGLLIGGLTSAMVMDFRRFRKKHTPEHQYPKKKRHVDGLVLHPSVRWLRTFEEQDGYKILLCHHPEYWCLQTPMLRDHPIDLAEGWLFPGDLQILLPLRSPASSILGKSSSSTCTEISTGFREYRKKSICGNEKKPFHFFSVSIDL